MPQPQDISRARANRDAALRSAIAADEHIRGLDAAIARADRAGQQQDARRLRRERHEAEQAGASARAAYARLRDDAFGTLVDWLAQTPEQIVEACSDDLPFVLLPIRIETKFVRTSTGADLRVRFFPDDISIAAPLSPVSEAERVLGVAYWKARAAARHAAGNDAKRRAYEGAWTALATQTGAYRASFIVRATAPQNPDAAPGDLHFADPIAPDEPPVARADLLPDRFVVITYTADPTTRAMREVNRAIGAPIPDNLMLASEGDQPDSWMSRDEATGRLIVPDALKWMVDFDAAVAVGMALRIPLTHPHDTFGFDRVLAIGVRSATPPEDASAALQSLFSKHRFGDGFGLVPLGTPTNNADTPSGWQPPSADAQQLFAIEDSPPDVTPADGMLGMPDGTRLGDLLGLGREFVRRLPNATRTDVAEALVMNRAATPGTLDYYVEGFLKGLVSPQTAADLHSFFVTWVTGRGHYPALRIGRQPYGIVVTSAWGAWKPLPSTTPSAPPDITQKLYDQIAQHRFQWQTLARFAPHAAQPSGDPFQRLLRIIGQLASSREFVSRRAISDISVVQWLTFRGATAPGLQQWFSQLEGVRGDSLTGIHFPPGGTSTDPLLIYLVYQRETSDWRLPLIDRDPLVALSETSAIAPYDGQHNYLWWLTQASRADLTGQRFLNASGTQIPAPTALLYFMLRNALLAALESVALEIAGDRGAQHFDVVDRDPLIANIGDAQHVQRRDYLEIDAAKLGLARSPQALVDWTLDASRLPRPTRPSAAERLAEVNDAIAALAGLPTARLERLLTEHVDLCSFRLDAWITALYSQRLALLKERHPAPGLHLGAFGWIENLRPATADRTPLPPDAIPESLRDVAGPAVFDDATNGGYVHAPSLMQAATAAVLRNGYLSHAGSDQPQTFAVNLSSGRVRDAMALADGVRSGQAIAALLGYQFERGLHEGHVGLELDQHIYTLRDRFPLLSGRLTDLPPGTTADVIEARNVVDGLALVEATANQAYAYGIGGLPAAGSPEAAAIAFEIDRLRDALDAVSDVLLAEGVHQVVQGNVTRTQAAQQALTSPAPPPEPDIVRTPRSGRVLTFRLALALDADAVAGWTSTLSPRARASAPLNHWLSGLLPPPAQIQWTVRAGTSAPAVESLADLGLEPLDLILMSGDRLGDRSSELERFLIRQFRFAHAVVDDVVVEADFSKASAGRTSLATLQPLLMRLRRLVIRSRAAHAADWRRSADESQSAPGDPTGSASGHPRLEEFKDLTDHLESAKDGLTHALGVLESALTALAPLIASLETDPGTIANPAWTGTLNGLRSALFAVVPYGVPEALPADGVTVSSALVDRLLRQGIVVSKIAEDRLRQAAELLAPAFSDALPAEEPARTFEQARRNDVVRQRRLDAAKAIFGPAFPVLPLFTLPPDQSSELAQSLAAPVADGTATDEWLLSACRVRPSVADLAWAFASTRWSGHPIADPAVVQFPHRAGTPWIGGTFGDALPTGEWLSIVVVNAEAAARPLQAGLLIDDWTETVPEDRETTGVAFNFNRPNAVAPQAVLVAVTPELRGHWTFDDLVGSVHEALDLAKMRAVELESLIGRDVNDPAPSGAYFQFLPAILSEFTEGRLANIDFASVVATALAQPQP